MDAAAAAATAQPGSTCAHAPARLNLPPPHTHSLHHASQSVHRRPRPRQRQRGQRYHFVSWTGGRSHGGAVTQGGDRGEGARKRGAAPLPSRATALPAAPHKRASHPRQRPEPLHAHHLYAWVGCRACPLLWCVVPPVHEVEAPGGQVGEGGHLGALVQGRGRAGSTGRWRGRGGGERPPPLAQPLCCPPRFAPPLTHARARTHSLPLPSLTPPPPPLAFSSVDSLSSTK